MAITYNVGTNIITVTGYTEAVPCNFTDIYNADVAGGWGKVTRQCTNQFCFDARLQIGDGSTVTWLADELVSIRWNNITTLYSDFPFYMMSNGHIRLGRLLNDTLKTTGYGCHIHLDAGTTDNLIGTSMSGTSDTDIQLYSLSMSAETNNCTIWCRGATGKAYNCIFQNKSRLTAYDLDVYNYISTSSYIGLSLPGGLCEEISIFNSTYGIEFSNDFSAVAKNVIISGATNIVTTGADLNQYLVNVVSDTWLFHWLAGSDCNIYRQYEFDLKVIDKDNVAINAATVKIWDKDSNLIVDTTTHAGGIIATQTITRGYYKRANGNTLQEASPHLIKIEKAGYTTYEADFTLEDKTDWLIALQTSILRNPSMGGGMV